MTYSVDAVVVGAGVVGLACARRLAQAGLETILIEREARFGQGISSRNSEVIHAGLYYEPNSLKAKLCSAGRERLYAYCESRNIEHRRVGKWIVATREDQLDELKVLYRRALQNGVGDVVLMEGAEARVVEPELICAAALNSPSTGIVDSHGVMMALLADFEAAGGVVAYQSPVIGGDIAKGTLQLALGDAEQTRVEAGTVINSAGLDAPVLADALIGFPREQIPERSFAKGNYFSLTGKSPFERLIYPLPEPGGLGVHLTLDLQGQARFGPDVEWVAVPEYSVDPSRIGRFVDAIRRYWPACDPERLTPAYAGVRPKLGSHKPLCPTSSFRTRARTEFRGWLICLASSPRASRVAWP